MRDGSCASSRSTYAFLLVLLFIVPLSPALAGVLQIDALRKVQWFYWTYTVNIAGSLRATADKIPLAHSHIWSLCAGGAVLSHLAARSSCTEEIGGVSCGSSSS